MAVGDALVQEHLYVSVARELNVTGRLNRVQP
jgi:hypothetical protein